MERKSIGNSDDIRDINSDIVFPIHMLFIIVLKSGNISISQRKTIVAQWSKEVETPELTLC